MGAPISKASSMDWVIRLVVEESATKIDKDEFPR